MSTYNPKDIEPKWQKFWEKHGTFEVTEESKKQKFYSLIEFPYPSGEGLHVGHPRPFTAMDVVSRKKRMEGYNVLYPIGFDAFGLPTENFAIKTGKPPAEVTKKNIANFTRQLKALGYSFDWSRQVDTTDPAYYKWTQWLFLQFYKHGLAYKKNQPINWCPKDKIGLANEEVVNGCCERCGAVVEKRNKEQWMLAITKYADKLLDGLNEVDYIPQAKIQQENWIGRSEGASVRFVIARSDEGATKQSLGIQGKSENQGIAAPRLSEARNDMQEIEVFTTRPDTIFGVTFVAVSAELAQSWVKSGWEAPPKIKKYTEETIAGQKVLDREEKEKTGVDSGLKAINPVSGEEVPVWITNYVMGGVGTGAIMGVPAHDERDFEFAKKYNLPIKEVAAKQFGTPNPQAERRDGVAAVIIKDDKVLVMYDKLDEMYRLPAGGYENGESPLETIKREITEETGYTHFEIGDYLGEIQTNYYVKDKGVHRYRFQKGYAARLTDEDRIAVSAEDEGKHEYFWFNLKEALAKFQSDRECYGEEEFVERAFEASKNCFTDPGIAINSDLINGLPTTEAKEKMIAYLEEKGIGKRKVNYKLRDWVFSRQRYWGEPIPLVYCESCKNKKQKALIIHGFEGSGHGNWLPWMKQELEKNNFEVVAPTISTSSHPTVESWVKELKPYVEKMGENDIIIGHSLGSKAALHVLHKTKKKIGRLYLVASAIGEMHERDWDLYRREWKGADVDALKKFWEAPIDFDDITNLVNHVNVVLSSDDPWIKKKTHDGIPASWTFDLWSGYKHFQAKEIPELRDYILQNKNTGWIPLPESELPLTLPKVDKYEPTDNGESPLAPMADWVNTKCPQCGGPAKRETDTMPNWAGSSWYFLRYADPHNDKEFASMNKLKYWLGSSVIPNEREESLSQSNGQRSLGGVNPTRDDKFVGGVDWYNGGMEHTVLHLLYSRFWNQFLFDIGLVPTREPYKKRTSHGLILASDGEKMSKSRGNVVNPDEMIEKFSADALRTYIMFMGPFDQAVAWDTNGLVGVERFLEKVWTLTTGPIQSRGGQVEEVDLARELHKTIKKVSDDIEAMRFNTAVASMMEFINFVSKDPSHFSKNDSQYKIDFIKLLSPFAPHMCEEIWSNLGNKQSIAQSEWPKYDPELAKESTFTIAVQINGKVRDQVEINAETSEADVKKLVLASDKVQKWLEGKEPKKIIYVKGKLVSVVI